MTTFTRGSANEENNNRPYCSVDNLVNGYAMNQQVANQYKGKSIEAILKMLIGQIDQWDSEPEGKKFRIITARVVNDYAPEFPNGYIFVDTENVTP